MNQKGPPMSISVRVDAWLFEQLRAAQQETNAALARQWGDPR